MAVLLGSLVSKAPTRNLSLSRTEIRSGFGGVGYHAPRNRSNKDGREALEKE